LSTVRKIEPPRRTGRSKAHGSKKETLILSARNLPGVEVIRADSLNVVALLNADTVLIEQPAISKMEEVYA